MNHNATLLIGMGLLASTALAQVETRLLDPTLTGPDVDPLESPDGFEGLHVAAYDPGFREGVRAKMLVLFIPGGGAVPTQYARFAQHSASLGLHALGIAYESWPSIWEMIRGEDDPDLAEAIRRERLFGEPQTDLIEVDEPNSISGRLSRALTYLHHQYPGEGWDQFIDGDGALRWRRIIVAGHSQGAGHSAYLTKNFTLGGALLFAGPGDFVTGVGPAPWLFQPSETPVDRMLAFTHVGDRTAAGFFGNQRILGLDAFGPLESVDRKPAGELSSHMLTSLIDIDHENYHSAVVVDDFLPSGATGDNVYQPVWTYLLSEQIAESRGCRSDVDADGVLTLFDFLEYQNLFSAGDAAADFDGDGALTLFDFLAFQNAFSLGCS
ncbi:MAG: GC-type dockerin domain-anchored protein [Planctomycetota bacterium]